ncbi:FAD/NAD(P)-binding domain-containing protein [Agrocybe pediades]|nr:FAD/NAD(P)-binding domain-containing protein [Agrocybe pediades]
MSSSPTSDVLSEPLGILGAGMGGLISAHVLLQDGFKNITVITRDASVGGTWARHRVYDGLHINNVHGEYRFSSLEMPLPPDFDKTGGHITGLQMCEYMETFYSKLLKDKVKFAFEEEIVSVERNATGRWRVEVTGVQTQHKATYEFSRVIVATGGCSNPKIPHEMSLQEAKKVGYTGMVLHSSEFRSRMGDILATVKPKRTDDDEESGKVLVVGGGKSAMDICAKLAREGRRVVNVFETPDAFIAAPVTLPNFIRKSRLISALSPHVFLRTRLERFLHTTTIGSCIVRAFFHALQEASYFSYSIPRNSPLRGKNSVFWGIRTNDEGRVNDTSFYSLVNAGQIELVAPARATGYARDGKSIRISNGREIKADVVILATGWQSSWKKIFDENTATELGLGRHPASIDLNAASRQWDYKSLSNSPATHHRSEGNDYVTHLYRGIVPGKNINKRDFAIMGATFSSNITYSSEVAAHWISSYFQGDRMRLPRTPEDAIHEAEVRSAWMRRRYPNMLSWANESYSGTLDFWTWPQAADELLEDMHLPIMRSGGNWLTWPFRTIDMREILNLSQERKVLRDNLARGVV